ncbi:lytic transglycosylase domain-containing protein, partial [Salmonella enterica subsp. enterica serovar Enteritidis]|nr:lytic transglycosylase domain-containing protein [Salmonella enterica subsp. enterica serovar Enteritidis]
MAKKGKDDFDEIDLDNMDDWDDFDEPPRQQDQSRNPVMDTFRAARKSALSTIWPENKRDQVILKGMPKPASDAYEGYKNVKAAGQDILAHTKDEIEKTSRVVKAQARQLGPTLKRYLPDSVTRKIDKWAKSDQYDYGNYDPKQALMDRELDTVFAGTPQTAEQQREVQEGMVEDRLRDTIKDMKSDALFQTVIGIAKDVNLTTSLSRGVMLNVQRKQLELQYRTLFALQDIAKLKQDEFSRNTPALEAIVKNTALPDYAKEEFSEVRWANVKRKAAEWMNPLRYADNFIEQIRENAKKKISNIFSDGRGILEQVLSMSQEDDFGMDDSSTLSPERRRTNSRGKVAGFAGSWLAKRFLQPQVERLQNWTRSELEKNPEVMKRLQLARYGFGNLSSISNSAIAGEIDGPLATVFRLMHEMGLVTPLRREGLALEERSAEALSGAAKFDRKAYLSITEVIPTLLTEINKSIRRGYGEHHDQVYDLTTRGMVDRKVVGNRVRKAVANDEQRKRLQQYINETVDFIDKDKTLDSKTRQALADYIESRASEGKAFDVGSLLKDPMHMYRYMNANAVEAIQAVLEARSSELTGGHHELSNEIAGKISAIQSTIRARQNTVDEASIIYGENALRDAGIFKYDAKNDRFDVDKDINDPYTLYNDLAMGKTRSGRSLTREQEIQRKLKNGSALGDYLRRLGVDASVTGDESTIDTVKGKGGRGGRGLSARQLAAVLYGEKSTNFVELLSERPDTTAGLEQQFDRIVDAIRNKSESNTVQEILKHVKNMDEEGILLASLGGGRDGEDDASEDAGSTGNKRKRKRIVLGE